jgi:hypothetical protein
MHTNEGFGFSDVLGFCNRSVQAFGLLLVTLLLPVSSLAQKVTFNFNGNIFQSYTVPADGWYLLDAQGAQGGPASNNSHQGGKGAWMQGYAYLTAGDVLQIAVGGAGEQGQNYGNNVSGGGGGGGSSIVKVVDGQLEPLLFAGGGGGGAANYDGSPGLTSHDGERGRIGDDKIGGAGGASYFWSGGTQYDEYTAIYEDQPRAYGGEAYVSGNFGGDAGDLGMGGNGGWGGGGEGGAEKSSYIIANKDGGGGGGGGYSGGDGGVNEGDGGGGGGSYLDASLVNQLCWAVPGYRFGDGLVEITPVSWPRPSSLAQEVTFNFNGNQFQSYTVPADGWYLLDAIGAQGGASGTYYRYNGGRGAWMQGYAYLTAGDVLQIAVGGAGEKGSWIGGGGGGGGSSIVKVVDGQLEPLLFAGGGGGASANYDGSPGLTTQRGGPPNEGDNGNGGGIGANEKGGAGGAGYFTDGGTHYDGGGTLLSYGGQAYVSGNFGGGSAQDVGGNSDQDGGNGGWGGGGSGGPGHYIGGFSVNGGGGGGGGYSGGGGGDKGDGGGGGGSYVDASLDTTLCWAVPDYNWGDGLVAITPVSGPPVIQQPADQQVAIGESVTLGPVHEDPNGQTLYQWMKDGVLLDGQTGASLTIASFKFTDSGGYQAIVQQPRAEFITQPTFLTVTPRGGLEVTPPVDQDQAVAFYDDQTGILTISEVRVGDKAYRVELINLGDFEFELTDVQEISASEVSPAYYDVQTQLVNIPNVFAFDTYYQVQLKDEGDNLFNLVSYVVNE